ncbi:DUF4432 family protein [Pseudoruegeria sp. SHC-113]|uniref:DUF4432 family protein n=1 Tax=Pseudoruegeria sp. SHC-113 TaxID=2855439 RepID=UPI0021BA7EEB|nr:DUF4432 family protein [Pseudoruegeria sp. SHC-113]MCT8159529.1 DUF4432 family protein [Pseudoruegeria sp. SHC-113]
MIIGPVPTARERLTELTGDRRQLASVRRITLDDGPERGLQALAFSTGGGLDFWVLSDRTMDIGPLWYHGMPVAWQHPGGTTSPKLHNPHGDNGTGVDRALTGFLLTCGLDNVRQPRNGLPLHGTLPLTPARITSHGEDWDAGRPFLFAQGEIVKAHLSGPSFALTRRIEAPIGGTELRLVDTVENIGPETAEFRILYHTNFGFPAVGAGTSVSLNGHTVLRHDPPDNGRSGPCAPAMCRNAGDAPVCTTVLDRPAAGQWRGLSVAVETETANLPYLQVWSDPRPRRNIVAIEPANCDRNADGTSGPGTTLNPGETWTSTLTYRFASPDASIEGAPNGNG